VVITDGFTGNVVLKWLRPRRGDGKDMKPLWRKALSRRQGQACAAALQSLARKMDYSEYGGALLLGVGGITVIAHGRSVPKQSRTL